MPIREVLPSADALLDSRAVTADAVLDPRALPADTSLAAGKPLAGSAGFSMLQRPASKSAAAIGVQRMPRPGAGRCTCGNEIGADGECVACRARRLAGLSIQRAAVPAGRAQQGARTDAPAVLGRLASGRPLASGVRSRMEPLFGQDFSRVRVHTDADAASLAAQLDARAFTVANHVALGSGEYQPGTRHGDALLAHELAHVVQQADASPTAAPLPDGSSAYQAFEHDAETAAVGVVANLWSDAKTTVAPTALSQGTGIGVQRQPRTVTGGGVQRADPTGGAQHERVPITVVVNEEVEGPEFCIRAIMQTFGETREAAVARIANQHWTFYGWHTQTGVHGDWVGKPITFWARMQPLSEQERDEMVARRAKIDPRERDLIYAEVDETFFLRAGQIRVLGTGNADAQLRRLWLQILDERLRAREAAPPGSETGPTAPPSLAPAAQADPYQAASDAIQDALLTGKITSDKALVAAFGLQQQLSEMGQLSRSLSPLDQLRWARRGPGPGQPVRDWVATLNQIDPGSSASEWRLEGLDNLRALVGQQQALKAATERLRGTEGLYGDIKSFESWTTDYIKAINRLDPREVMEILEGVDTRRERTEQSLSAAHFGDVDDFDAAARTFRKLFRDYAAEIAWQMLGVSERVLWDADVYRVIHTADQTAPPITQQLYAAFKAGGDEPSTELQDRHRILMDPDMVKEARRAQSPTDLAARIGLRLLERRRDLYRVEAALRRDADVVFKWDVVVDAAIKEMGLEGTVFPKLIADERGKEGKSLTSWLIDIGLIVLSFATGPFGWAVRGGMAAYSILESAGTYSEFGTETIAKQEGLRTTDPSKLPLVFAAVNPVLNIAGVGAPGVSQAERGLAADLGRNVERATVGRSGGRRSER